MHYMHWNWQDLMECPAEIYDAIVRQLNIRAEQEDIDRIMRELQASK